MKNIQSISCIALVALAAGCASPPRHVQSGPAYPASYPATYPSSYPSSQSPPRHTPASHQYGTVDSVKYREAGRSGGLGMGAVLGGVVGGVLGNQVGGGSGRKAATVAGVVGGAMVGHEMEQRNGQLREEVVIGVRLDNGSYRHVVQDHAGGVQVGSRVRIENERVYRY